MMKTTKQFFTLKMLAQGSSAPWFWATLTLALTLTSFMAACTDDRSIPTAPPDQSYSETQVLIQDSTAAGQDIAVGFDLRDSAVVVSGAVFLSCYLESDANHWPNLAQFEAYQSEIDSIKRENDILDVLIPTLAAHDTTDTIHTQLLAARLGRLINQVESDRRNAYRDVCDTYLDNLYKVSFWLDNDTSEYYPYAVYLKRNVQLDTTALDTTFTALRVRLMNTGYDVDTSASGALTDSLSLVVYDSLLTAMQMLRASFDTLRLSVHPDTMIWGQGIFLAPHDSTRGWRGKTMRIDLGRFWVADGGWRTGRPYFHPNKPKREESLPELYPIPDYSGLIPGWIPRLNDGLNHTLHVRFAGAGNVAKVTATLYVVYNREG